MHLPPRDARKRRLLPLLIAAVVAGCAPDAAGPTDLEPALAREKPPAEPADPTATWYFPLGDAGLTLRSDGRYASGGASVYAHAVCGVNTRIFVGGSGDATIQSDNTKYRDRKCAPRTVTFAFPDGSVETGTFAMSVRDLHSDAVRIGLNETVERTMGIRSSRCEGIHFGVGDLGNGVGSTALLVTRISRREFQVRTPENGIALCRSTGELMPATIAFTIVADSDLPFPGEP